MKIRVLLGGLSAFLGLALLFAVAVQIWSQQQALEAARRTEASNAVREDLLLLGHAMAQERTRTYTLLLSTGAPDIASTQALDAVRTRVDDLFAKAVAELNQANGKLPASETSLRRVGQVQEQLAALRLQAQSALAAPGSRPLTDADRWLAQVSGLVQTLQQSRSTLLQQETPPTPTLRAEASMRGYSSMLQEDLSLNQALVLKVLLTGAQPDAASVAEINRNLGRIEMAWEMLDRQLSVPLPRQVQDAVAIAHSNFSLVFSPLQQSILDMLQHGQSREDTLVNWSRATEQAIDSIMALQQVLLASSRNLLADEVAQAERLAVVWVLLQIAGVLAVATSMLVVRRRVLRPLEGLTQAMLKLADNDLSTPVPRLAKDDEVSQMTGALRVFKSNAIRRQRTENERNQLHVRLQEAYDQLRRDLEAAAAIQEAMLPADSTSDHVHYEGLYRPSSLVAGDTYNVVRRPDGRVGFFQIDVAGHGAPAALVSVACQQIISQAYLTLEDCSALDDVVARVNSDWPEQLPYFTMVFGEVDAERGQLALVQAGHPSPILLRRDGSVRVLDTAGFPVGLIEAAHYDLQIEPFGPSDRLFIYSDGVTEMTSPDGRQYGESRLLQWLQDHGREPTSRLLELIDTDLKSWRGADELSDDVSILVLGVGSDKETRNDLH